MIRPEFKLVIYAKYLLPSLRFLLTVHTLTKTTLSHLDDITEKYLKLWIGLPQCATREIVHHRQALSILTISEIYNAGHNQAFISTWTKGDERSTKAMEEKCSREETKVLGDSRAQDTKNVVRNITEELGFNNININEYNPKERQSAQEKIIKEAMRRKKALDMMSSMDLRNDKIASYKKQGDFLQLVNEMEDSYTWKSYIYNLPKGTLKFLINASINTLPTLSNLKQWGKITSDKCPHCGQIETTFHILNCCKNFLEDGRYLWRHNNIVSYMYSLIDKERFKAYADLPEHTRSGSTIPSDIIITSDKPDLVLVSLKDKEIFIYELTVPSEKRLEISHAIKTEKYQSLCTDLSKLGWKVSYRAFEVGSRGLIPKESKVTLFRFLKLCNSHITPTKLYTNVSMLAAVSSYKIFITRKEKNWISPNYLLPY